jgi:acetyl/propionyl-CoA carboxylase alpha subunit
MPHQRGGPYNNFAPSPGKINLFYAPGGRGVRVDTHVYSGYEVPPNYDSMIAKLIVTGATRDIAIARMIRSLKEFIVRGIKTTIPFQASILEHAAFRNGKIQYLLGRKFPRLTSHSARVARLHAGGLSGRRLIITSREGFTPFPPESPPEAPNNADTRRAGA